MYRLEHTRPNSCSGKKAGSLSKLHRQAKWPAIKYATRYFLNIIPFSREITKKCAELSAWQWCGNLSLHCSDDLAEEKLFWDWRRKPLTPITLKVVSMAGLNHIWGANSSECTSWMIFCIVLVVDNVQPRKDAVTPQYSWDKLARKSCHLDSVPAILQGDLQFHPCCSPETRFPSASALIQSKEMGKINRIKKHPAWWQGHRHFSCAK